MVVGECQCINFVALNREVIYEYEGSVSGIAQAPWDQIHLKSTQTVGWKIRGTVKLQRLHDRTLAASVRYIPLYKSASDVIIILNVKL